MIPQWHSIGRYGKMMWMTPAGHENFGSNKIGYKQNDPLPQYCSWIL